MKHHFDQIIYLSIGIRGPDKREEFSKYSRSETRCMCRARMKIRLKDGFYYIYEFEPEHNHILTIEDQRPDVIR
jgi:zinc finger SWIM domain-containing protein 3